MRPPKPFTKQERRGVFYLLVLILIFQVVNWSLSFIEFGTSTDLFSEDLELHRKLEEHINSKEKDSRKIRSGFNPNFISDFKGYTLGMSNEEIDRLHQFRKEDKWINSADDFQRVTGVSDSLLQSMASDFKFPDWVEKTKVEVYRDKKPKVFNEKLWKDINSATAEDLETISGIGGVLSDRIIRFRNRLGGFRHHKQFYHIYGLKEDVVERLHSKFRIIEKSDSILFNVNNASAYTIRGFVYFNRQLSNSILRYRDSVGIINSWKELEEIDGFPQDKIEIIELYLSL